ncbi:MAG: hypothetical protein HN576_09485 [Bacteriovoracaceae bacterium]|nr:hypothetical protein [Bacteriovoracaceae bacterium]
MNQLLTSNILKALICISLIAACSASKNPRLRQKGSGFRGLNGVSSKTYQELKNRVEYISVLDLEAPQNGEEIEYLVEYNLERNLSFILPEGKCSFVYKKVILKESVFEQDSHLKIQTSSSPQNPTFIGLPIQDLKLKCVEAVKTESISQSIRIINLGASLGQFKNLINGQIFSLVDRCESRQTLKEGKCINLDMHITSTVESIIQDFKVYKIKSKVRFADKTKEFNIMIQLTRPYFKFYGIISLDGGMPLGGIEAQKEIKSLELLRWVK